MPTQALTATDHSPSYSPSELAEDSSVAMAHDSEVREQTTPRVWVLVSDKRGDDSQSEIIARSLGWPYEVKQLRFTAKANALRETPCAASSDGLDPTCRHLIQPPWPDLVISAGWQQEPVVRWIKRQSGGRTKLVQLNRPYGIDDFDLVIVPPQHAVPNRGNVLRLKLPLHRKDDAGALAEAAAAWQARFEPRPHPWIAVMIGGPTPPFVMDDATVDKLMADCRADATRLGGTLFVTTSPRTPESALPRIEAGLGPNDFLHLWSRGQVENPYLALLALCDRFMVTADSPSMISEIIHLGKAVSVYPLPQRVSLLKQVKRLTQRLVHGIYPGATQHGPLHRRLSDWANRRLKLRYYRDLDYFRRWVIHQGWASSGIEAKPKPAQAPDDLEQVSKRVRALVEQRP